MPPRHGFCDSTNSNAKSTRVLLERTKLSQRRNALPFDIFAVQKAQESVDFSFGLERTIPHLF